MSQYFAFSGPKGRSAAGLKAYMGVAAPTRPQRGGDAPARQPRALRHAAPRHCRTGYTPSVFFRGQLVGGTRSSRLSAAAASAPVFLAEDTWLDKKVALKVPHRQQNLDFTELLHEPRLLGSMSHPNIVTVLTAEKQEGVFFIVMEYVAGETLETIIMREGALELTRALDFSVQIANAVDHAHSNNVIHRELRPGNVLVSAGLVQVADFGTSRVSNRRTRHDRHRQPADTAPSSSTARPRSPPTSTRSARHVPDAHRHPPLRNAVAANCRS